MTDVSLPQVATDLHTNDQARGRLKARYRAEFIFKALGLGALLVAAGFLVIFLSTIITQAIPAFTQNYIKLAVELKPETLNPDNASGADLTKALGAANYDGLVAGAMRAYFPAATDRNARRSLGNIMSSGAPSILRREVLANPSWLGTTQTVYLPLDDNADLYLKGQTSPTEVTKGLGELGVSGTSGQVQLSSTVNNFQPLLAAIKTQLTQVRSSLQRDLAGKERVRAGQDRDIAALTRSAEAATGADRERLQGRVETERRQLASTENDINGLRQRIETLTQRITGADRSETLDNNVSSYFVRINGGIVKLTQVQSANATGEVLMPPTSTNVAKAGEWEIVRVVQPESNRRINDREIAYLESLKERSLVERRISREFFFGGASREAELAGVWVAIVGSFLTLLITLGLSFPVGVAAAIYLEELAPKNRLTEIIEVNINNLAAVPSIVFGLLGAAIFINWFKMPLSAPLVGGLVLSLMTLPTVIIATRASLKAVPPSIRQAALGIGASKVQTVFHHVLPLALPGILTGAIIGVAQALGETAPLLLIGMSAFVANVPATPLDQSTALPVQIYLWQGNELRNFFEARTSAAIIVLLGLMISLNAFAIWLRKKFEVRW